MLNSKSLQLFKCIVFLNITSIKLLIGEMTITEKKLRYELSILRDYIYDKKFGKLVIKKGEIVITLNKEIDFVYENIKKDSSFNSAERQDYIFFKLLSNETISLNKISKELNISKVTCRKDLNKLSEIIGDKIKIQLDKSYYLCGNEKEIRQKGIDILLKYLDKDIKKIAGNNIEILNENVYDFLGILTNDRMGKSYLIIYAYLIIALLRTNNNHYIKEIDKNILILKENKLIYDKIKNNIGMVSYKLNKENEILQILEMYLNLIPTLENKLNYTKEFFIELEIKRFIYGVSKKCKVKFYEDLELVEGIVKHLRQAIYRANINMQLLNVNFADESEMPKELFEIIKTEIKKLEEIFNIKFSNQELFLFMVHFQACLEKKENINKKTKNILLLCVGGYGTTNILINKLNQRYEINNIVIVSKIDLFKINIRDYDLLISTIDCNDLEIDIETLKISPLITNNEIKKLDQYFKIKNNLRNNNETIYDYSKNVFSDKNIFYINEKITNWEDVIKIGVEKMEKLKYVDMEYYDKLIKSIVEFGPYTVISKGIAIPHAISDKENYKSGYVVIYLNNPVIFPKNKEVQLLFFLYNKNRNDNRELIENIIRITQNNNLDMIKDEDTLKKYLIGEKRNVDK